MSSFALDILFKWVNICSWSVNKHKSGFLYDKNFCFRPLVYILHLIAFIYYAQKNLFTILNMLIASITEKVL